MDFLLKHLFGLLLLVLVSPASAHPVISITGGEIRGRTLQDGSSVFQAVPFARPPVGNLRWRAPQPVEPWSGVRDGTRAAPACTQFNSQWAGPGRDRESEDCLYLELRTPDLTPPRPLPVMVWIHGGGNAAGSPRGTVFSSLPTRGVVLIAIQYRLGPFGFLSHPDLTAEGNRGNFGFLDQQAALRWVHDNIAAFGGDPENVTVFGGSAGAQAVGMLLLSPSAKGLFHKAIMQSGTPDFGVPAMSLSESEAIGKAIIVRAGSSGNDANSLRAIPADELVRATLAELGASAGLFWARPVVDGSVVREAPSATLARGDQARVPLIIGTNAQELAFPQVARNPREAVTEAFGRNAVRALEFYGIGSPGSAESRDELALRISTDLAFHCPANAFAEAHARAGLPVWRYVLDYRLPGGPPLRHFSELRYVFNAPGERTLPQDAPSMQAYWVAFAKMRGGGIPNDLQDWPRFQLYDRESLVFSAGGPSVEQDFRAEICGQLPA